MNKISYMLNLKRSMANRLKEILIPTHLAVGRPNFKVRCQIEYLVYIPSKKTWMAHRGTSKMASRLGSGMCLSLCVSWNEIVFFKGYDAMF